MLIMEAYSKYAIIWFFWLTQLLIIKDVAFTNFFIPFLHFGGNDDKSPLSNSKTEWKMKLTSDGFKKNLEPAAAKVVSGSYP